MIMTNRYRLPNNIVEQLLSLLPQPSAVADPGGRALLTMILKTLLLLGGGTKDHAAIFSRLCREVDAHGWLLGFFHLYTDPQDKATLALVLATSLTSMAFPQRMHCIVPAMLAYTKSPVQICVAFSALLSATLPVVIHTNTHTHTHGHESEPTTVPELLLRMGLLRFCVANIELPFAAEVLGDAAQHASSVWHGRILFGWDGESGEGGVERDGKENRENDGSGEGRGTQGGDEGEGGGGSAGILTIPHETFARVWIRPHSSYPRVLAACLAGLSTGEGCPSVSVPGSASGSTSASSSPSAPGRPFVRILLEVLAMLKNKMEFVETTAEVLTLLGPAVELVGLSSHDQPLVHDLLSNLVRTYSFSQMCVYLDCVMRLGKLPGSDVIAYGLQRPLCVNFLGDPIGVLADACRALGLAGIGSKKPRGDEYNTVASLKVVTAVYEFLVFCITAGDVYAGATDTSAGIGAGECADGNTGTGTGLSTSLYANSDTPNTTSADRSAAACLRAAAAEYGWTEVLEQAHVFLGNLKKKEHEILCEQMVEEERRFYHLFAK